MNRLKLIDMDIATLLEITTLVEIAEANGKESPDYKRDFECETTREYQAYIKGQQDALQATIGQLKSFVEDELYKK